MTILSYPFVSVRSRHLGQWYPLQVRFDIKLKAMT